MQGRTVLITGATDGLGRALAADLAGRGARVLVHGRDRARVDAVASEVGAAGAHVADLASLAGFLLPRLLEPALVAAAPARIVNVASAGQMAIDFDDVMLERAYDGTRA